MQCYVLVQTQNIYIITWAAIESSISLQTRRLPLRSLEPPLAALPRRPDCHWGVLPSQKKPPRTCTGQLSAGEMDASDVTHKDRRGLNHSFLRLYIRVFDTSDPLEVKQGQMVGQGFLRPAPRLANLAAIAILRKGTEKGPRVEEHTIYYSCVRIFAGFHIAAPPIHPSRSAYAAAGVALERKIAFHTAHHQPTSPRCFKLWGGVPHLRLLAGDQA